MVTIDGTGCAIPLKQKNIKARFLGERCVKRDAFSMKTQANGSPQSTLTNSKIQTAEVQNQST